VLLFGGLSLALWAAAMRFIVPGDYFDLTFFSQPVRLLVALVVVGACFGLFIWEFKELCYRRSSHSGNEHGG